MSRRDSRRDSSMFIELNGVQYVVTKGPPEPDRWSRPSVASIMTDPTGEKRTAGIACVYDVLNEKGYWEYIPATLKFIAHFGAVAGLLFVGAWMFMFLEDPVLVSHPHLPSQKEQMMSKMDKESNLLWTSLQSKYNFTTQHNETLRKELLQKMRNVKELRSVHGVDELLRRKTSDPVNQQAVRDRIRLKWFYFSFIASTTIGYGDIVPVTYHGRIFYIVFSIVAIAAMMTLLRRFGELLTTTNIRFYKFIMRHAPWESATSSENALTFITMVILFLAFLGVVVWYDMTSVRPEQPWSIDIVYFWIMTFTTVGFGSEIQLDVELDHVYGLMLCRVVGLAFLAGIIDSLVVYLKNREWGIVESFKKLVNEGSKKRDEGDEGEGQSLTQGGQITQGGQVVMDPEEKPCKSCSRRVSFHVEQDGDDVFT